MSTPLLHVLAALWLALLSPALCCCGIRTSLGSAVSTMTRAVHADGLVSDEPEAPSCPRCASRSASSDDTNDHAPGQSCHCHEISRTVDAPAARAVLPLPALVPAFLAPPPAVEPLRSKRGHVPPFTGRAPPRPPGTSLVALHCMLTT